MQKIIESVERETLYEEVWSEPVSAVAVRYGLSDVGLAKICRSLAIPLPSRGYWAKVKAGRIMGKAPLPKLEQGIRRATGLVKLSPEQAAIRSAAKTSALRIRGEAIALPCEESPQSQMHPLVQAASARLRQRDGWSTDTPERAAPKEVLHLSVTKPMLARALAFTDRLLKILMTHGFDFEIDRIRGATFFLKIETNTKLEFTLTEPVRRTRHVATPAEEKARKKYWERLHLDRSLSLPDIPNYDYIPTGVLTLQIGRWPSKSWKDTPIKNLEQRLGEVVAGIVVLAADTHARELEEARRQDAHRQKVARYEFLTKRRLDEAERFKRAEASANDWERAAKLRAFANAVEGNAIASDTLSAEHLEWLGWVRAKADWLDPLIHVSDPILDAPEPKQPGYC